MKKTISSAGKGRNSFCKNSGMSQYGIDTWKCYLKTIAGVVLAVSFLLLSGCKNESPKQPEKTQPAPVKTEQKVLHDNGITFSHESGIYYVTELQVQMKAPAGYTIAYTTNGRTPTEKDASGKSEVNIELNPRMSGYLIAHKQAMLCPDFYNSKLNESNDLPAAVVLNASLVDGKGALVKEPRTMVYFLINDAFSKRYPQCMIVSVTTDPKNLIDHKTGILASGAVYEAWKQTDAGKKIIADQEWWKAETNCTQRGKKWERPCLVQFYTDGDKPVLEMDAGIRIRGGMSRRQNQKSFTLYFNEKYGVDALHFKLFEKEDAYKRFGLRNGGDDSEYLKFKDVLLQDLAKGGKYTVLDKRPAVLFLNGEYWGPYSLCEVTTANMMNLRYGVDEKNLVVIKEAELDQGKKEDFKLYEELQEFGKKDLTNPETYRQFCDVMDVQSMADYFAMQVYIGNADCAPDHNHILWRSRDKSYNGGRWQYVLHDLDYSAGHYEEKKTAASTDHFALMRENFPVFAAAVKNKEFYDMFLASLKKMGSKNFEYNKVREKTDLYDKLWSPLMPDFYKRYGDTANLRKRCMNSMLTFFMRRYEIIIPIVEKWKP